MYFVKIMYHFIEQINFEINFDFNKHERLPTAKMTVAIDMQNI